MHIGHLGHEQRGRGEVRTPKEPVQPDAQIQYRDLRLDSIPWAQAVKEGSTFKSADELRALYKGKGVALDHETVAYCHIDERSSHTWFVLNYLLGVPKVPNYDGSWMDWSNLVAWLARPSRRHSFA